MAIAESLLGRVVTAEGLGEQCQSFHLEYTIRELFGSYLEANPVVAEKIANFREKVANRYSQAEKEYIERALIIATVAHQFNHDVDARTRRETDPETGCRKPYIYHPLETAERLVREKIVWTSIVAILLHDVAEDVDLGEGLATAPDWINVLKCEFSDTSQQDLIADLIEGMTEKPAPDLDLDDCFANSPLAKMIENYVLSAKGEKLGKKELPIEDRETIYKVVFNLERLFNIALISPDHLQLLILKVADIWHNFQSPEWIKQEKVLRGRVAASIADWFGWYSMRSDIIYLMAGISDTNSPFSPAKPDNLSTPREEDSDLSEHKSVLKSAFRNLCSSSFGSKYKGQKYRTRVGRPVIHTDHHLPRWEDTTLPVPEVIVSTKREIVEDIVGNLDGCKSYRIASVYVPSSNKKSSTILKSLRFLSVSHIANAIGRSRVDFSVEVGNYPACILRVESDEPYVMDFLKRGSNVNPDEVPEIRGLFHAELHNTSLWNFHLSHFIAFLYEPNLAIIKGNLTYLLIRENSLYFVSGKLKLKNFLHALDMSISDITHVGALYMERLREILNFQYSGSIRGLVTSSTSRRKRIYYRMIFLTGQEKA